MVFCDFGGVAVEQDRSGEGGGKRDFGGGVWRNGYRLAEQKPDSLRLRYENRPGQWLTTRFVADYCRPVREAG